MNKLIFIILLLSLASCSELNACIDADCKGSAECKDHKLYKSECVEGNCEMQFVKDCSARSSCYNKYTVWFGVCVSLDGGECDYQTTDCRNIDSRYECVEKGDKAVCAIPPQEDTVTYVEDTGDDLVDSIEETKQETKVCTREQGMACSYAKCETNDQGDSITVYYGCLAGECVPGETVNCKEKYGGNSHCVPRYFGGREVGQCTGA